MWLRWRYQPDVVVVDKKAIMIDVAVPKQQHQKEGAQEPLEWVWGVKTTVVSMVIGVLGAPIVPRPHYPYFHFPSLISSIPISHLCLLAILSVQFVLRSLFSGLFLTDPLLI